MADNALPSNRPAPPSARPTAPSSVQRLLGRALLRPAFDWLALRVVAQVYLRLSRGWAAALASDGNVERFLVESGLAAAGRSRSRPLLARVIAQALAREADYRQALEAWDRGYFGAAERDGSALAALERARREAAHQLMAARLGFLPWRRQLALVAWELATPEEVEARHGQRLAEPAAAFPPPELPDITRSRAMAGLAGQESWLRFESPVLGDSLWAHVYEPAMGAVSPTAIFLHGIGMETEMWRDPSSVIAALRTRGFRVISTEGPWHGRRRLAGRYGGEPILSRGLIGLLDLMQAWVAEIGCLIRWARAQGGPVALVGVSLGALAAQRTASAAAHWPLEARPDALKLVATSGEMLELASSGSLAQQLGLGPRLRQLGWDEAALRRWLPLLEPDWRPPLPPERVVMTLGAQDDLTPYAGGLALAEAWRVPRENLFVRPQGHFSVAIGVLNEPAPLDRLTAIVKGL